MFFRTKNDELVEYLNEKLDWKVRDNIAKKLADRLIDSVEKYASFNSYSVVQSKAIDIAAESLAMEIIDQYREKILTETLTDDLVKETVKSNIREKLNQML